MYELITCETNGQSVGKKRHDVCMAFACHISASFLPKSHDSFSFYALLEMNLISVPRQKYETAKRRIFSSMASFLSSPIVPPSDLAFPLEGGVSSSKFNGDKCIRFPMFKLKIQSS
jgi:hypothetical protein